MTPSEPERTLFTLDEARALIPWLRPRITAMRAEQRQFQAVLRQLNSLTEAMRQNGHATVSSQLERQFQTLTESLNQKLQEIIDEGIEVKDIESGVVDFPSLRDDDIVYLCWHIDEPTVLYWHPLDSGFRGRQRLDE
jgi:hypothetical protein